MNMHCASRLGWIRSLKEASPHAPEELTDPAQAGSATSDRATRIRPSRRLAARNLRASIPRRAQRGGLLFLAAATLLFLPALTFADVPVATITGDGVVKEGASATYNVALTLGGSAPIIVSYDVTGTATAGVDYTAPSGLVTIAATTDQNSPTITAPFTIMVTEDDLLEVGETLVVTLKEATTTAGTVAIGSPAQVTTTIRSADTVLVTVADASSDEGSGATFTVATADALGAGEEVVISYATANGSAIAGRDYTATSGTLTLSSGSTSVPIMVPTEQDDLFEGAEKYTFTLRLVSGPNGVALQKSTVTGTIDDDDALTASVVAAQATVVEGSVATFRVMLAKTTGNAPAGSSAPVLVDYRLSGLDEEDHDGSASGTVTIPAGQTMGTIAVRTVTDDVLEDDETLTVTLEKAITGERIVEVSNPTDGSNSTVVGDQGRKVTVSIDDISVDEGDAAVFTVSVSRSVSAAVELTVGISGDVEPADYQSNPPANVTIAADMMTAKLTIETRHDDLVEGPEELTVTLSGTPPGGVGLGKVAGTATIRDGDTLQASVMGPSTVPEGLPATYTVTLDGETSTDEVVVDYRIGGTATVDVDYTDDEMWNGSLTIAAAATTGAITIPTMAVEGDGAGETMVVTLTDAATEKGAASVGTPRAVTTTFTPQDTATVSVAAPPATFAEGDDGEFTVSLTGGAHTSGLVVSYTFGGTVSAADVGGTVSGTLTFEGPTDRSKTVTVSAADDMLEEGEETVTVTLSLSGQASGVRLGTPMAMARITDADMLTLAVANAIGGDINEGADATFTVTVSDATSTADVVVEYEVGGEVTATDYTAPDGMLVIPAGSSTGAITVSTIDDEEKETREELTVTLTEATTGGRAVTIPAAPANMATVPIVASDGQILLSISNAGTVTEGEEAVFAVALNGTLDDDLEVTYSTGDGTATAGGTASTGGEDFTAADRAMLTITAGQRSATIRVATRAEMNAEADEDFTVTVTEGHGDVSVGTGTATATIRDDDPIRVNLSAPRSAVAGNDYNATLEVTGGTPSVNVTVNYTVAGGPTLTATITAPDTTQSFTVDPGTATAGSSVTVSLVGVSTTGRVSRGTSSASTRLIDSNTPVVWVATPSAVSEDADDVDFTVNSTAGSGLMVVVSYSTGTRTASGSDFKSASGTLTIVGTGNETVMVELVDDTRAEADETFTLTLSSPRILGGGTVVLTDNRATATINDNDDLTAAVERLQTSVLEGSDARFEVKLTANNASASGSTPVVVSYMVNPNQDGATAADYTEPSGKLTIPAGQSSGTIVISTTADDILELEEETIAVQLTDADTAAGDVMHDADASDATAIRDSDGTVVVSVADPAPVEEGQAAVFTVSLSGEVSQDVALTRSITPAAGDDFSAPQPAMLTIAAGETTGTIVVQTTDEASESARRAEADEPMTLSLGFEGNAPPGVVLGKSMATGTIRDNDPLRVNISGPSAVASNADNAVFEVSLTGGMGSVGITVDYTYRVGSRTDDGSVPITANTASAMITITNDNDLFEAGPTLVVTLTDVETTAGTVTRGTSSASARIASYVISASDVRAAEGAELSFNVTAAGPAPADPVVVRYSTSPGSARANDDYTSRSGTITIGSQQPDSVPALADTLNEGDETVFLRLSRVSAPSDVLIGTPSVTGTIGDDGDDITATVAPGQTTVTEGEAATFIVSLDGGTSTATVVIDYTVGGSAMVADGDYTAPSRKLNIPAGATAGTIAIQTLDDGALDRDETLTVTLDGGTSAGMVTASGTSAPATTIADASDGVTVSVMDTTVDEGETAMLTVELSGPVDDDVTVPFMVDAGTATEGSTNDYVDPTTLSVTIEKGKTTQVIPVETRDDMLAEASETFTVTLSPPDPTVDGVTIGDASATVTITDDALTATVVGPAEVEEASEAEYTVTLTGGTGEPEDVTVRFSVDEASTATAGVDFSLAGASVTIPVGEMMGTFTIRILEDEEAEVGETVVLNVEAETADGDMVRVIPPAPTTITDDDGSVDVSIMTENPKVPEGEPANFIVELTGTVANADLTLQYTVGAAGDTATREDYTAADPPTITIPAGQMSATFAVTLRQDGESEPDETLSVELLDANLPEGVAIADGTDTVRITDFALMASVTGPATVTEGQSATFTIELTGGDENRSDALVRYTATAGTAQAPGDFDAPSGTLTIPQGQTSGTVTIVTKADGVLDPSETLVLTLTEETSALGIGLVRLDSAAGSASTTIADEGSVTWSVGDVTVEEGDAAVFTVTLNAPVQDPVTLTYRTADDTATAGSDYTGVTNGTVTVPGNSTSATFSVETVDDTQGEATESFTVELTLSSDAPMGVEPRTPTRVTVTITDDDIRLRPVSDVTITEGETKNVVLSLEQALLAPVTVRSMPVAGTTASTEDFAITVPGLPPLDAQGAFTLPAGFEAGAIAVTAVDDSKAEGTEELVLALLTVPTSGGQPATLGTIRITIEDNDELAASVTGPDSVDEGELARFTVKLGGGTGTAPVVVSYEVSGTAKAPGDYTAPSGTLTIDAGQASATIAIQTNTDNEIEPDETLVVTLTTATTANGTARVGSPKSATTAIQDEVFHSFNRVNRTLLPGVVRASAAGALEAVSWRMAEASQGDPPAGTADLAGLTGLYRALQANERALQDGSYDLAKVLGGSSFLVPLSSHDGDSGSQVGIAVWGGGDFRGIGGGDADTVDWDGSVWSARVGVDMRFVDSLLTGIAVSWASGALDYVDATPRNDREGTYATWLVSAHPYVGWTSPDFGLWATGGIGWGGLTLDDSEADAQEADLTQWSVGAGGSVTLLSTDWFIAGGTTAVKLKAEGFLAGATVAENESKLIQELSVGVNQARAAVEASHAQHFAGGGSLKPSLEIGGRFDGGDGETGAGMEVGGGLTYADPGSGLTVAAVGRALVVRDGNYGEWGLTGLIQLDPNAAGHGLMMSVRPTWGVTASGVSGLWEHGTLDLLAGDQPGGSVEAQIGYGLPAFGTAGVLTPYAGAALTDAGAHSLSVGGRLELGPAFDLALELERSESADPDTAAEHDLTLEGSFRW